MDEFLKTSVDGVTEPIYANVSPGDRLGRWRVDSLISVGGMGAVYRGHRDDGLYDQDVAIKLIGLTEPRHVERFEDERKKLARLNHPNICRIIDGGKTEDNIPFMVVEHVDGERITQFIHNRSLTQRQIIKLLLPLCNALTHAHSHLILHGDIKPSNILIDKEARVKLIDFGVSVLLGKEDATPATALTPGYAAPELLAEKTASVQSDIFAFGILLRECLMADHPESLDISLTLKGEPDLVAIIEKATRNDPNRRYASITTLKADLGSWLEHKPVSARAGNWRYITSKYLRRHKLSSSLAALLLLSLSGGIVLSSYLAKRAIAGESAAVEALNKSEFYREKAEITADTQSTYANVLQRVLGQFEDFEPVSTELDAILKTAYQDRLNHPDDYALTSFTIARLQRLRTDNLTAYKTLQNWLSEGLGSPSLVARGNELMARVCLSLGYGPEALDYLKKTEAHFAKGYDAFSDSHLEILSRLAKKANDIDDTKDVIGLLNERIESTGDPDRLEIYYQESQMLFKIIGDQKAAYKASVKAIAQVETGRFNTNLGQQNKLRQRHAVYEYYLNKNHDAAELLAKDIIKISDKTLGDNINEGRAYMILGQIAADRGKNDKALEHMKAGFSIIKSLSGTSTLHYIDASLVYAETLARTGQIDRAAERVSTLITEEVIPEEMERHPMRVKLAQHYINYQADSHGIEKPFSDIGTLKGFNVERSTKLRFHYLRLIDAGVEIPI